MKMPRIKYRARDPLTKRETILKTWLHKEYLLFPRDDCYNYINSFLIHT